MAAKSNFGTIPPPPATGIPTLNLQCFDSGVQSTPVDPEISNIFDRHFFSSKTSLRLDVMPLHAPTMFTLLISYVNKMKKKMTDNLMTK